MMYLLEASFVLAFLVRGSMCDAKTAEAAMYTTLHALALPPLAEGVPVTERFILLEPGEVLNYYDYVPLTEDTPVFNSKLPPDEAAFRLSDTVPSLSPLGGSLTGKSLSTIYSNILYTIDTSNIVNDPFANQNYLSAMEYLQEKVSDPANASLPNVSRSVLYQRYKKYYYEVKLQVSQWIIGNQSGTTEQKYENWYRESYLTLQAFASAAYSQWLVEGMKGIVEDKLSIVDIKSVRSEIEDTKMLLQNEAIPSKEGGSNYYPVDFIPSNWYEYLQSGPNQLTPDQIQAKIADLESQKTQLALMMNSEVYSSDNVDETKNKLKNSGNDQLQKLINSTKKLTCLEYNCQCKKAGIQPNAKLSGSGGCPQTRGASDPCDNIEKVREDAMTAVSHVAHEWTATNVTMNQFSAYDNASMQSVMKLLQNRISNLQNELSSAPSVLPPVAVAASGTEALTQKELDQNWMAFSFDSASSISKQMSDSTTYKAASSFSVGEILWSVGGSASYSRSAQNFAESLSSSKMSVSAKMLRVTFRRNWFQPSIFSTGNLNMQGSVNPVSPGPMEDQKQYVDKAQKKYQLPEYTTGFLLAKDVSMTFKGVDTSTVSHTLQTSASSSLSGSYFCFRASFSFGYGHTSSNLRVSSNSYGLQIDIPGAQIIGYYTSVLPEFPSKLS